MFKRKYEMTFFKQILQLVGERSDCINELFVLSFILSVISRYSLSSPPHAFKPPKIKVYYDSLPLMVRPSFALNYLNAQSSQLSKFVLFNRSLIICQSSNPYLLRIINHYTITNLSFDI